MLKRYSYMTIGSWESMWCDVCSKWDCVECHLVCEVVWDVGGKGPPKKEMRLARPGMPQSFHTVHGWDVWNQRNDGINWINYQPQLVSWISAMNSTSRVWLCNKSLVTQLSTQVWSTVSSSGQHFFGGRIAAVSVIKTPIPTVDGWNPIPNHLGWC